MIDLNLFINFLLSSVLFLICPLVLKYVLHKSFDKRTSLVITIVNSLIVLILIQVICIVLESNSSYNVTPCFLWGFINYYILNSGFSHKKHNNFDENEDEDLKKIIDTLQK